MSATVVARLALVCALVAGLMPAFSQAEDSGPQWNRWAKPLAQEFTVVYRCRKLEDPNNPRDYICVGSPYIVRLPSGKLLASFELWLQKPNSGVEGGIDYPNHCMIYESTDDGNRWHQISTNSVTWASLFDVGEALYSIGVDPKSRNAIIVRSDDEGHHWSPPTVIAKGDYSCGATSVVVKDGMAYKSYLGPVNGEDYPKYGRAKLSGEVLLMGDTKQDLADSAAWRRSDPAFGPQASEVAALSRHAAPMPQMPVGTMEGNAFVAPDGRVNVLTRLNIDDQLATGLTARFRYDPQADNKNFQFVSLHAMQGGQNKFQVIFDERSSLYWACVTPVPDTQPHVSLWGEKGFRGSAGNTRRMLMLLYSADSWNWFEAGCVAVSRNPLEAFHYASLTPSGDDMLVLSRTSLGGAPYNNHDSNMITLHRVKDFRSLALDLRTDMNDSAAASERDAARTSNVR